MSRPWCSSATPIRDGLGIAENPRERLRWWREAARLGSLEATEKLVNAFPFDSFDKQMTLREGITAKVALYNNGPDPDALFGDMAASTFMGALMGGRAMDAGYASARRSGDGRLPPGARRPRRHEARAARARASRRTEDRDRESAGARRILRWGARGIFRPGGPRCARRLGGGARTIARRGIAEDGAGRLEGGDTPADASRRSRRPRPRPRLHRGDARRPERRGAGAGHRRRSTRWRNMATSRRAGRFFATTISRRQCAAWWASATSRATASTWSSTRPEQAEKVDFEFIFTLSAMYEDGTSAAFGEAFIDALRDDARLQDPLTLGGVMQQALFAPGACEAILAASAKVGIDGARRRRMRRAARNRR